MTISDAIRILMLFIVGTMSAVYLVGRIHAVVSAIKLNRFCAKNALESKRNEKAGQLFHDGLLQELSRSAGQLALAFFAALAGLVFLWFVGSAYDLTVYRWLMICFHIAVGAAFALGQVARFVALSLIPSEVTCRPKLQKALRKHGFRLLLLFVLYTAGCWVYSL